jgi:acyl-homoserine lactone acylase PvdQ
MPGWDSDWDWKGFVSPEALPRCFDPPSGVIVTANNDLNHPGESSPINHLFDATGIFIDFYTNFDQILTSPASPWLGERALESVYRAAFDRVSDDVMHTSLAGGPSDRRFSKLYTSDLDRWKRGGYKHRRRLAR